MRRRWRLYRPAGLQHGVRIAVLLAVVFAALALTVRLLCLDRLGNSSFWPANGAVVVAILLLPRRLALYTALACFCVNLLLNHLTSYTPAQNLLYSALNIALSYFAAFLTRSLCGAAFDLSRFRRLSVFACIAFVSAGLEAAVGDLLNPAHETGDGLFGDWLQWTLCDGLGLLLATPAILLAIRRTQPDLISQAQTRERWLLLIGTVLIGLAGFAQARSPIYLLIYPALILTAFRAGPSWVFAGVVLTSITASAMTSHGYGPLALLSPSGPMLKQDMLQPYLVSLFLAAVPANNALGEKTRATRRLLFLQATMEHEATHDTLTALPNRELFQRRLAAMLQTGSLRAVVFLDLDRFKQVNDTLGHQAGDELLRMFSLRLIAAAEAGATVARFGGDEFAILIARAPGSPGVDQICQAIVDAARTPFLLALGQVHVSASVGVALAGSKAEGADDLMRKADMALYAVKAAGRDDYLVFCDELGSAVHERAELEGDLRAALDGAGGLTLQYQIKVGTDGSVEGVEALVRWCHPSRGPILPPRFIGIAEETGLIMPLGAWVFREALGFAERWPRLQVAINVSAVQLRHPAFVSDTLAVLRASSVPPGRIELEVTETALLNENCPVVEALAAFRAAGLRIALDDFGTGYSSLCHLHRFAVDRLKIDQSFVFRLGESAGSAAIVQAVVDLGHAMGLQVTAEGVETKVQRDHLIAAGVDELQGFYFARPLDEAALASLLPATAARSSDAARLPVHAVG